MRANLPIHEWCIILLFCFILLALAGFALNRPKSIGAPISPPSQEKHVLEVKIEGEVAKPGLYHLPLNATLKQLLEQVEPLSSADLSQLNGRRKLHDGQTIRIPERHLITIHLSGAVQDPGPFQILSGTRYCELVEHLSFLPEADLKSLSKRKGFLREGDKIKVSVKRKSKASKY